MTDLQCVPLAHESTSRCLEVLRPECIALFLRHFKGEGQLDELDFNLALMEQLHLAALRAQVPIHQWRAVWCFPCLSLTKWVHLLAAQRPGKDSGVEWRRTTACESERPAARDVGFSGLGNGDD